MVITDPISIVPLVGPSAQKLLENIGINTIHDLLYYLPTRYDDFSQIAKIKDLKEDDVVTISANIESIKNIFTRSSYILQNATVFDDTGKLEIVWFNQRFIPQTLKKGMLVNFSGRVQRKVQNYSFNHQNMKLLKD